MKQLKKLNQPTYYQTPVLVWSSRLLLILLAIIISIVMVPHSYADCKVVNKQCLDNQPIKIINGISFKLSDACAVNNLTGDNCCWNYQQETVCVDSDDTCGPLRKNHDCAIIDSKCIDKDYTLGKCSKFQSRFSCAGGYADVESQVCTNVVCANNESGTAAKCFNLGQYESANMANMGQAIATIQMGQSMAQDMNCSDINDPTTCTLFTGKYSTCYLYAFKMQLDSFNNNGVDCQLHTEFFTNAGVSTGYKMSDRNLYSQATSGTSNVMGNMFSYGLSNDDPHAINNTVALNQNGKAPATNQDQKINYTPNSSNNPNLRVNNGNVVSASINQDTVKDLAGFFTWKSYLSDASVNLSWNRLKSEPDPNNVKNTTFADLGITRGVPGSAFGWVAPDGMPNQPIVNGLCVHFGDYCEGGDDSATNSDWIKGIFGTIGGWTNKNFCAKCTLPDKLTGMCLAGEARQVLQEWCCFNSKVGLDINLAAYDQGLLKIYTGANRYSTQINHSNTCGGVTVGMISKIDFSKGNYFKDLMSSIDINQIIDPSNFTNSNIQGNTQNRAGGTALDIINEWKNKP